MADELPTVIAEAVEAMPKASTSELTVWIRKHHRPLIKKHQNQWIDDRLKALFAAEIRRQRPMKRGRPGLGHPDQYRFSFPGFEDIPYQFVVDKSGKSVRFPSANRDDLKARRGYIKGSFSKELPQLNRLIDLMEPYDKNQPGIRVAEVFKLRAASRRAPDKTA